MKLGTTKEYHYQKLAPDSRKVCYTFVYLATLLHSNNTNDVKELNGPYTKRCCKDSCCPKFIIALKEKIFSFLMPLSAEVGVSVAAYSELLHESRFTFFSELAGL